MPHTQINLSVVPSDWLTPSNFDSSRKGFLVLVSGSNKWVFMIQAGMTDQRIFCTAKEIVQAQKEGGEIVPSTHTTVTGKNDMILDGTWLSQPRKTCPQVSEPMEPKLEPIIEISKSLVLNGFTINENESYVITAIKNGITAIDNKPTLGKNVISLNKNGYEITIHDIFVKDEILPESITEQTNIQEQEQLQITPKEAVTIQDEIIIDESKVASEISKPSTTPQVEKLNPPELSLGQLEGDLTDKDFTGQPSTLEKETKITKKQEQKAVIVLATLAVVAGLIGTALYVMSKRKK